MYQKLNLNSYETSTQNKHLKMYQENITTSARYQQQKLLKETENKLFLKKRIDSIVRNQHSRTLKNTMTASVTTTTTTTKAFSTATLATLSSAAPSAASSWLRSLNLFKTNHRRYLPHTRPLLLTVIVLLAVIGNSMSLAKADDKFNNKDDDGYNGGSDDGGVRVSVVDDDDFKITATTIPITMQQHYQHQYDNNNVAIVNNETSTFIPTMAINETLWFNHTSTSTTTKTDNSNSSNNSNNSSSNAYNIQKKFKTKFNPADSIFLRFAKRFTDDNSLWSGIIQDCYKRPTFSCFQKNVYYYLNDVLETRDINVTQGLKFYKNENQYDYEVNEAATEEVMPASSTPSYLSMDSVENAAAENLDETDNEIPHRERSLADNPRLDETPIEEVTNALYGKSIKFAMTHDIELKLPEMMFDGATFRISPQAIEGNGVIAKLELIPKQQSEARLAGKILMKKIQKFLKSKLLLSFLALVLIIKIIKIKLFWLLPLVIGVGAAKKLLLKFLLFLFPALSHLFKLCSYYQQTYHSTKYHHHHHHINHHHTVVPAWHSAESPHIPEIIYTNPPKGHISAYLHGAPIHETYGPPSHEHYDSGWANSGPGLGSEFISDINRVAHVDDKTNQFKPHSNNDANELHAWGLGTTPINNLSQKKRTPPHATTLQKPPIAQQQQLKQQQQQQHPQNYQKPQATSHTFNPFIQSPQQLAGDKQSFYHNKYRNNVPAQSAPSPVYTPARQPSLPPLQPQIQSVLSQAAQIAAQYDPARNQPQQTTGQNLPPQTQLTPELSAQIKEAIRIQAEQRLVQQQQQILNKQPFVQDGKPLMPLNYDPFYSPILLKIDKIVEQLGVTDDLCKERLVCSMYKDPQRYSPHSNFVSAELSRDTNELEPIKNTNQAVIRFFRLIQAARDGQDHKDCMALYPNCNINTE